MVCCGGFGRVQFRRPEDTTPAGILRCLKESFAFVVSSGMPFAFAYEFVIRYVALVHFCSCMCQLVLFVSFVVFVPFVCCFVALCVICG